MARTLETLTLGTPVVCGQQNVGTVRGLYAEGQGRAVEWVVVDWPGRGALAVPATEVESVDERGVTLLHADPNFYHDLMQFNEAKFPTVHKIG